MSEEQGILSQEDIERVIEDVVWSAEQDGTSVSEMDLRDAVGEMESWHLQAALLRLWDSGRLRLSWNAEEKTFGGRLP